jgi:hypothetical protein
LGGPQKNGQFGLVLGNALVVINSRAEATLQGQACTMEVMRGWKEWKAKEPAFHPSHSSSKSLRDSHIPTASATRSTFKTDMKAARWLEAQ